MDVYINENRAVDRVLLEKDKLTYAVLFNVLEMIYEICRDVVANGQMPMLYADADYYASNRCYQNIGFELKGRLVTIGCTKAEEER